MDRRKVKTLSSLIIAAMLLFPMTARSEPVDHVQSCHNFADITRSIAQERDAGVPANKARSELAGSKLAPERKKVVESMITTLYGNPGITPDQAAAAALQGCLGHQ
jgi:hypothetical protein